MKIVKVEILNFKGIKNFKADFSGDILAIAGPNNSGKSTILNAIRVFFSFDEFVDVEFVRPKSSIYERENYKTKVIISFKGNKNVGDYWYHHLNRDGCMVVTMTINHSGSVEYKFPSTLSSVDIDRFKEQHEIVYVPVERTFQDGIVHHSSKISEVIGSALVGSRKGSAINETLRKIEKSLKGVEKEFQTLLDEAKKNVSDIYPDGSKIGFSFPSLDQMIYHYLGAIEILSNKKNLIHLRSEGSGYQSLISLGVVDYLIKRKKKGVSTIVLVEEPEAFLHPQYQRHVVNYLRRIISGGSGRVQIFLTTHSTEIVNHLSLSSTIKLTKNGEMLDQVVPRLGVEPSYLNKIKRDLHAGNSEIVFSRKIILVEGDGEFSLLRSFINRWPDFPPDVAVIKLSGADQAVHYSKIIDHFGLESLYIFDRDKICLSRDRKTLKSIMATMGIRGPSLMALWDAIDRSSGVRYQSYNSAKKKTAELNKILFEYNVYSLISDLEFLVSDSFDVKKVASYLKKNHGKVTSEEIDHCLGLSDRDCRIELARLMGSKGLDCSASVVVAKIKPHIPAEISTYCNYKHQGGSELSRLLDRVRAFALK